ncbi:acylphosphatase-2 [Drosophila takahashii]|uniref:acylphosphatase-2 n=1 Tax=Drosophila takahashii TaxID=29030 RepID=UPI001CF89235|nr:acylphosphatase-2 [Drosophila takahashii]
MSSQIKKSKSTSPKLVRSSPKSVPKAAGEIQIFSCQFEVFGHVQGVFFRKHTQRKAKELGITGWCMNTTHGTVKGMLEGSLDQMTDMKYWLQHKGSPRSMIEKAVFSENEPLPINNFKMFSIRR